MWVVNIIIYKNNGYNAYMNIIMVFAYRISMKQNTGSHNAL